MSNKEKERRCKFCSKLLLDEKIPFCRRCVLEGRNKVGQISSIAGGLLLVAKGTVDFVNDNSNKEC